MTRRCGCRSAGSRRSTRRNGRYAAGVRDIAVPGPDQAGQPARGP